MAFYVKDEATDRAVRRLAKLKGKSLTETVKEAVENELARATPNKTVGEALDELTARFAKIRKSGKRADKQFFDKLWEND